MCSRPHFAEDLIPSFSDLQNLEEIDLVCRLYDSYKTVYGEKAEPFDSFAKWGNLILQDFNEIDRYLVDASQLYSNLHNIKEIENWSLSEEKLSEFQVNYLEFMKHLGTIYSHFTGSLLQKSEGYQGLSYRIAVANYKAHPFISKFSKLLFCGFNALNKAETHIFSDLCRSGKAEVLWDADHYYLANKFQEAGLFMRRNLQLFGEKEAKFIGEYFKQPKNVEVISVPKQMGQAQTVSSILKKLLQSGTPADKIAIVLANEKLLWPVLKMLPPEVQFVTSPWSIP